MRTQFSSWKKLFVLFLVMGFVASAAQAAQPFGWRAGTGAWSFRLFSFFEAIEKAAEMGMPWIEPFEGQQIMSDSDVKLDASMPEEYYDRIREKLEETGVTLTSIYIHNIPGEEEACRRIFDFAKGLGVSVIVSEPDPAALDVIERFCDDYDISVALHNHPEGKSIYWHPDVVLEACAGRGPRIGACADTGHWIRSGLKPADMFRLLKHRLLTVHLKDVDRAEQDGTEVPWGTGCGELEEALRAVMEEGLKPLLFSAEYEDKWENNMPEIMQGKAWFDETVKKLAAEAEEKQALKAGWAHVDITPERPVALMGQYHTRISEGVLDPLTLTALALESESGNGKKEQAVVISCDLCFVERSIVDRVREGLREKLPDLDASKIIISATHTHDGPALNDSTIEGVYDTTDRPDVMSASEYGQFFVEKAVEATVQAWETREPSGMSWALGTAVVGINRRVQYFDGTTVMYGNTARADFKSFEGSADPGLPLLFFWTPEEKLSGVLVNLPCPSQETESLMQLSADFWHEIRIELKERLGEEVFVLGQSAAAGDISPHRTFRKKAEQIMLERKGISHRQEMALRIARAVEDVLPGAKAHIEYGVPFRHVVRQLDLPEKEPPAEPFVRGESVKPAEFHMLRLGDIAMASFPFEYYLDYGLRIQARSDALLTFTVQLANGQSGYLPTEEAVQGGGYSAERYMVTPVGGQQIVDETVKTLNAFWP